MQPYQLGSWWCYARQGPDATESNLTGAGPVSWSRTSPSYLTRQCRLYTVSDDHWIKQHLSKTSLSSKPFDLSQSCICLKSKSCFFSKADMTVLNVGPNFKLSVHLESLLFGRKIQTKFEKTLVQKWLKNYT